MTFATTRGRELSLPRVTLSQVAIAPAGPPQSAAGTGAVRRIRRGRDDAQRAPSNRASRVVSNWSAARFSRRYS